MEFAVIPTIKSFRVKAATIIILVIAIGLLLCVDRRSGSSAQGPGMSGSETPISTPWRPAKHDVKYSGARSCTKCHAEEAARQHQTAMGRALEPVANAEILKANPALPFAADHNEIVRRGDQSLYIVTDGTNTISEPILYTFGQESDKPTSSNTKDRFKTA